MMASIKEFILKHKLLLTNRKTKLKAKPGCKYSVMIKRNKKIWLILQYYSILNS